ncbi:3,4-dihydroxy-2-butanone-4-phosphate synthase [Arthrobacter agilis]|nr:3,4-dihydroxy-2-butanone-4-phosphate synthase [Arthrobacter agilis]PPB47613.1 3,4-dihydroxy-2-butanone-4-phosphate synthase [Arthrobacter agilis]TPV22873.1 3,4-dihydroxy-2-butanone-4-phosphate synthase [Arthrobacter agilis]
MLLDPVQDAVDAIASGGAVVVVDDEDRENEGDIVFAAEDATPQLVGWTVRWSSGVLCVPMLAEDADRLLLPPMTAVNEDSKGTAYTVSCDAATGVSTGISAADRARTVRVLADAASLPAQLTRPGHVFPLRAAPGGVRERPGHTEAGVELSVLAGKRPAAVIAELVHDDGDMMRLPALRRFADANGIPLVSIKDLVAHLDAGGAIPAGVTGTSSAQPGTPRPTTTTPPQKEQP